MIEFKATCADCGEHFWCKSIQDTLPICTHCGGRLVWLHGPGAGD